MALDTSSKILLRSDFPDSFSVGFFEKALPGKEPNIWFKSMKSSILTGNLA